MRFYCKGNKATEIVWDGENDRRLMQFCDGVFDTDDARTQEKLIAAGYRHDAPDPPKDPLEAVTEASLDMKSTEIREIGRRKGLKFRVGTTKEDMVKAINEKV
jgi:hypothetical protein